MPAIALILCAAAHAAAPATVTFTLEFPTSDPDRYTISVTSDGHGKYECSAKIAPESDDRETYQAEFDLSPAGRARVFDLAAQAHFFAGKIDSGNRKLAFTGSKTLAYKDGQRSTSANYNYSTVPAVQQLTAFFQNLSATLEFGRHLAYLHRYQKLALDEELKHMEDQARSNELSELQAVQPVLQQILDDASVMNVVRARAERLLEMGKATAAQ
ncbi:MAG: hypothetical protein WBQ08_03325 [Candidatus Sulfotelmatobacter sp.]